MIGYSDAPMAWGLTRGMARVRGVKLADAVVEGWLTRGELARMVDRCRECGKSDDCTRFLAEHVHVAHLPEFCPNTPEIEALTHDA